MSTIQKLEDLPNEVLLECFKYLNALHLFHSFDDLNCRFFKLIRSIELHLNFAKVTASIHEEFRIKTRQDPSITEQVISIDLSDKRSFDESDRFLSDYAMEEFPYVKYLSLTDLQKKNAKVFLPMLSSMPELRYFNLHVDRRGRSYSSYEKLFYPLAEISIEQLKQLNIPMLPKTIENPEKTYWLLEHLTIREITFEQIWKIVRYSPNLKQMQIGYFTSEYVYEIKHPIAKRSCAMNLEKLTIKSSDDFQSLEYLFLLTPNLKALTFIMEDAEHMIDGNQWERLISSFLANLIHFRFHLSAHRYMHEEEDQLSLKLKGFQRDFWEKEDFWQIRYEISTISLLVHSIPYPFDKYRLSPVVESYQPPSVDSKIIFDRLTKLSIDYSMIESPSSYFFPNVECLTLGCDPFFDSERKRHLFGLESILRLNELLSLSKIKQLLINSEYKFDSPSVILQLLKAATNLSTLKIDLELFRVLSLTNEQFSVLIQEKIRSLICLGDGSSRTDGSVLFDDSYSVDQFCDQYPHLEQLSTKLSHPSDFLTLLRRLPKLASIDADIPLIDYRYDKEVAYKWGRELIPALVENFHIRKDQILYHYESAVFTVRIARTIDSF